MADQSIFLGRGEILLGNVSLKAYDVEITPHSTDYEYFESYEGIISIKKQLDIHTELRFKVMLTEADAPSYKYNETDITSNLTDFSENRAEYVELRRKYLDDIDGQVVVVASMMFKPFKGVVSSRKYKIAGGETDAEYEIEVKEVE